jgi:prolyl oligopeptidase
VRNRTRLLAFALPLLIAPAAAAQGGGGRYPASRAAAVADTLHGQVLADPYRWLEDQAAPETRAWIGAQNTFRDSLMAGVPGRGAIAARLRELMAVDQQGTPTYRGGRYFYSRRAADQELSGIYMREGLAGPEITLVDPNTMAAEVPFSAGLYSVSLDGKLMAYAIRRGGEDEVLVRFYDVDRRRVTADQLPKARYSSVAIMPDRSAFWYVRYNPAAGPRLFTRPLGGAGDERMVFGEGFTTEQGMGAQLSRDGRWMIISVYTGTSGGNDLYLMDVAAGTPPVPMVTGTRQEYNASFAGPRIVVTTNWDAPKWRVMVVDPAQPAREHWRQIIAEGEHTIEGVSLVGGYVWVRYLENVVSRIRGFTIDGRPFREISMPALGSVSGLSGQWDRGEAFFSFSSYNTPPTIYRYDVARNTRTEWWRQNVPFDQAAFEVRQVWYTSRDGTRVPMFVAHRRGLELNGNNPTYLTGYGGFNLSQTPGFSAMYAAWMERGGVLAVPNLRGGSEFGEAWHRAGMYGNKQNVFDDFIAAAEWLIAQRYTSSERLAIAGGSNGGLLVGAAMTQRPELFRAVVCTYPLLDMVRYHRFLLGRYWVSEYGSAEDSAQYRFLRAYSPYHNVRSGVRYPATLFVTGDGDTRVAPLHARKMTALVQAATGASVAERPILLHYDTEAGHSGGLPLRKIVDDTAVRLHFVMWQLGMTLETAARAVP